MPDDDKRYMTEKEMQALISEERSKMIDSVFKVAVMWIVIFAAIFLSIYLGGKLAG